jgi:hypothetical protein
MGDFVRQEAARSGQPAAASDWVVEEFGAVLGVPVAGDDDFFALGGTSLAAAKLAMRLAARSGKAVSIADVLRSRTPTALAASLTQASAVPETAPTDTVDGSGPVSRPQRWYGWAYRGDTLNRAVVCFSVELPDGTDVDAVRAALIAMTRRHDALRMRITVADGGLTQQVIGSDEIAAMMHRPDPEQPGLLTVTEVEAGRDALAEVATGVRVREQSRGLALDGPLFRAVFVRGEGPPDERPCWLVVTAHHLVFDGTSEVIFEREIREACRNPDNLAEPPTPYQRFAQDEEGRVDASAQRWWSTYLSGFEGRCHLLARNTDDGPPTWTTQKTMPEQLSRSLAQRSREYRVPVSILRLAGLLIIVHALYDTGDAAVCMPVDERSPAWADTIGMFVDCVAVRHRTRSGESVRDMIDRLSADLPEVMAHRRLGFDRVARGVNGGEVEGRYPISGVIMNGGAADSAGPRTDEPLSHPVGRKMIYDMQLYFVQLPDRVDLEIQYRFELLTRAEAGRVLTTYEHILSRVAASGAQPVLDLVDVARAGLAIDAAAS